MTEVDVALTDYGLFIINGLFFYGISRRAFLDEPLRFHFLLFFGSVALASLAGGTVHGFFLDETTLGYQILWPLSLILIGATGSACWIIGSILALPARWISRMKVSIIFLFCAYILASLKIQAFWVAIAYYLPAALFLFSAFVHRYLKTKDRSTFQPVIGLLLTFAAAFVQQARLGFHPTYFNHNATYHLMQALGLWFIFLGAKHLVEFERKGRGNA